MNHWRKFWRMLNQGAFYNHQRRADLTAGKLEKVSQIQCIRHRHHPKCDGLYGKPHRTCHSFQQRIFGFDAPDKRYWQYYGNLQSVCLSNGIPEAGHSRTWAFENGQQYDPL